jgi:hypothetical protein
VANIIEPSEQLQADYEAWVESGDMAPEIKAIALRMPPWKIFRMKSDGHRVTLIGFNNDGTVTVNISGKFNLIIFERNVFGIDPDDLEECELPSRAEDVGSILKTDEEISSYMNDLKSGKSSEEIIAPIVKEHIKKISSLN